MGIQDYERPGDDSDGEVKYWWGLFSLKDGTFGRYFTRFGKVDKFSNPVILEAGEFLEGEILVLNFLFDELVENKEPGRNNLYRPIEIRLVNMLNEGKEL